MKHLLLLLAITFAISASHAQTFAEFFKQKKTQTKYSLAQIAAYQAYIKVAWDGYKVAKDGLKVIGDLKNGDFSLHNNYFPSLKSINPSIKKSREIADVISMRLRITYMFREVRSAVLKTEGTGSDVLLSVYQNLVDDSNATVDELLDVVTANRLTMKDDERLTRIEGIYRTMNGHLSFATSIRDDARLFAVSTEREKYSISALRALYGKKAAL